MLRLFCLAVVLCTVVPSGLPGNEKGTVRAVDRANHRLTVDLGGRTHTVDVDRDASLVRQRIGDKKQAATISVIEVGLAGIPVGSVVEFLAEQREGKLTITALKVTSVPAGSEPASGNPNSQKAKAAAANKAKSKNSKNAKKKGAPK